MTREDVMRLAREADSYADKHGPSAWRHPDEFAAFRDERFAALVAAHVRETEFKPDWNNYQQGRADGAAEEREAMLDLVNDYAKNNTDLRDAIRARGETK